MVHGGLVLTPGEQLEGGGRGVRIVPALAPRPSQGLAGWPPTSTGAFRPCSATCSGASGPWARSARTYLAFEPVYLRRVMGLGYADATAHRAELLDFRQREPPGAGRDQAAG